MSIGSKKISGQKNLDNKMLSPKGLKWGECREMSVGEGGRVEGISLRVNMRSLGCFLLVYFGGAIVVLLVTGGKQSQLLVLGLGYGV